VLTGAWLVVYPHTPDLAAQVYRVGLFERLGMVVWDEHWYAGHHMPGYSLLFPPLGALLGVRALGALAVLASTVLFARLAAVWFGTRGRWAALWFAAAAVGDAWAGRLAFALGVTFALAAALGFLRGRLWLAAPLALASAAASPVAGALLGLAALTLAIVRRSPRAVLTMTLPAFVVIVSLALLFPEGGIEPYPLFSFLATLAVIFLFLAALPAEARVLRAGALLYLLACVLCLIVPTPVGSNVQRYAVLLAGPLLLGSLMGREGAAARRAGGLGTMGVAALLAIGAWVLWGPVRETLAVHDGSATTASYYAPVKRFLADDVHRPVRIEVPLTRSHWEAALLAPTVSLARGWEKQLDERYDSVLLDGGLTAARYGRWLHERAVAYVALPDAPLDPSSAREGKLIRRGLPYLREVFRSRHWRIFEVLGPTPLAVGPGRLSSLGEDSFTLHADRPGLFLVRVHFTRYWTLRGGHGCVGPAHGGWTDVRLKAAGDATVAARFSLGRAFGGGRSCS
jgi:hypothetical protein